MGLPGGYLQGEKKSKANFRLNPFIYLINGDKNIIYLPEYLEESSRIMLGKHLG